MSLHLEFEPHSWYMEFAIKDERTDTAGDAWAAYTDDGMTYSIVTFTAETLNDLRKQIRMYHLRQHNWYGERIAKRRLNYLRKELRAARMSYGETAELESLTSYIDADDVELLEAAGVPEFKEQ